MSTASTQTKAIQPGELIVVTGANGYIGSNLVDVLLSLGYRVRGTVRVEKPWLNELFDSKYGPGKFETVVVPKLDDEEALLGALKGASGVAHVASDVTFNTGASQVIPYVVAATETILKVAAKSSVTRVVLTSSSTAALIPKPGEEGIVVMEDTWNDASVKAAWDENTPAKSKAYEVYAASKTEGERAAWNWIKKNQPKFVFNAVLPNMALSMLPVEYHVDVGDVARLHVIALRDPNVKSERIFAFAAPYTWPEIVHTFRKLRPNSEKLVAAPENNTPDLSKIVPAKRAEQLLQSYFGQPGWVSLEDSLRAGIDSLGY